MNNDINKILPNTFVFNGEYEPDFINQNIRLKAQNDLIDVFNPLFTD